MRFGYLIEKGKINRKQTEDLIRKERELISDLRAFFMLKHDRESAAALLDHYLQLGYFMEVCHVESKALYQEAAVIDFRDLFEQGSQEDIMHQYLLMKAMTARLTLLSDEKTVLEAKQLVDRIRKGYGPQLNDPKRLEEVILSDLVMDLDRRSTYKEKNDEFHKDLKQLKKGPEKTAVYKEAKEDVSNQFQKLIREWKQICDLLEPYMRESGHPDIIEHFCLNHKMSMAMTEYRICMKGQRSCDQVYEKYIGEALDIYAFHPQSETLRKALCFLIDGADAHITADLNEKADQKLKIARNMISGSDLIVTESRDCNTADALIMNDLYRVYRKLHKDDWPDEEKLKMAVMQRPYLEILNKQKMHKKEFTALLDVEYDLRTEIALKKGRDEILKTIAYLEDERIMIMQEMMGVTRDNLVSKIDGRIKRMMKNS